jgi:hypothetical protein
MLHLLCFACRFGRGRASPQQNSQRSNNGVVDTSSDDDIARSTIDTSPVRRETVQEEDALAELRMHLRNSEEMMREIRNREEKMREMQAAGATAEEMREARRSLAQLRDKAWRKREPEPPVLVRTVQMGHEVRKAKIPSCLM